MRRNDGVWRQAGRAPIRQVEEPWATGAHERMAEKQIVSTSTSLSRAAAPTPQNAICPTFRPCVGVVGHLGCFGGGDVCPPHLFRSSQVATYDHAVVQLNPSPLKIFTSTHRCDTPIH